MEGFPSSIGQLSRVEQLYQNGETLRAAALKKRKKIQISIADSSFSYNI
jgi:hypothetical protein